MMKTTLLSLAAVSLLACGPDASEATKPAAESEALSSSPFLDGTVPPSMDGGTPTGVETVIDALPGAIDFDTRANDVLVLRSGPSRVDACDRAGCYSVVTTPGMPSESATQTNASLAITSEGSGTSAKFLVAQKGRAACALDCTTDSSSLPGLYYLLGDDHPRRLTATVPLVYAKAFRATDGWLVGRGHAWAVDQHYNNEDFTKGRTTIYLSFGSTLSLTTLDRTLMQPGAAHPTLPFVFAQTMTNAGPLGYGNAYLGANGALVDASAGASARLGLGFVAETATATTDEPTTVISRSTIAKAGTVSTFDALTGRGVEDVSFPGIGPGDTLLATSAHVAYYTPTSTSVTLRSCTRAALVGGTCQPMTIRLPLDSVIRVRTRDDSVLVLGASAGVPRLVRVVFGG